MSNAFIQLENMFPYGHVQVHFESFVSSCDESKPLTSFLEEFAISVTDSFGDVWYYHAYVDRDGISLVPQHCLEDCVARMSKATPVNH